jgi:15-cis-phytoene synthase
LASWFIRSVYERTTLHRGVTEEVVEPELRSAYEHCRSITRKYARTFYLATRFLPHDKQRSIFAIYGLCRFLDNVVDEAEDPGSDNHAELPQVEQTLMEWKQKLQGTYAGDSSDNPILIAFSDVLRRHQISIKLPFELIDGVAMDLAKSRYETFGELYDYSYKVASVVGLMISEVFGYEDESALQHAVDLGIAMQLTNILRDVGEDLGRNRIYLPAEDLRTFGVTEMDLFEHRMTDSFRELMKYQIDRARRYYASADKGIPMLSQDSQIPVRLARHNYARILDQIEANGYQVFTRRAYLSFTQKMVILPRVWWQTKQ